MSDRDTDSNPANISSSSDDDESVTEDTGDLECSYGNITVHVDKGKLDDTAVDVIVNSTSGDLDLSQGAASRSLLKKGGKSIQQECHSKYSNGIKPGEIAVTGAGSLPCQNIYHLVLPKWDGDNNKKILRGIVKKCLEEASQNDITSIAFPALGTGNLGYNKTVVAKTMFSAVEKFASDNQDSSISDVRFVIFPADVSTYQEFTKVCRRADKLEFSYDSASLRTESIQGDLEDSKDSESDFSVQVQHITVAVGVGQLYEQQSDVLMTTCTRGLDLKKGTLSNSVLEAAGPKLQEQCKTKYPKGIQHGDIAVLGAANLPCKAVYCGALPRYDKPEAGSNPKQILTAIMKKCLDQAETDGMTSISFPTLGTGYLMYPPEESAHIMLKEINDFASSNKNSSLTTVHIVILSKNTTVDKNLKPFKKVCESYSVQSSQLQRTSPPKPAVKPRNSLPAKATVGQRQSFTGERLDFASRLNIALKKSPKVLQKGISRSSAADNPKRGTPEFCIHMYSAEDHPPETWSVFTADKSIKQWKIQQKGQEFFRLVGVDPTTYKDVENLVASTWESSKVGQGRDAEGLQALHFSSLRVTKVERIENLNLYESYCQKRQQLFHKAGESAVFRKLSKIPDVKHGNSHVEKHVPKKWKETLFPEVNEGFFLHGTKKENVQGVVKQGLDSRMAQGQAVFGQAIYMAESSTKADQYTDARGTNRGRTGLQMLIVRACLGDICLLTDTRKLCRPPCCEEGCQSDKCNHDKRYDSVVEEGKFIFREFVVYDSNQVYPEYLVTYDRV